jgi:hypothetical protein
MLPTRPILSILVQFHFYLLAGIRHVLVYAADSHLGRLIRTVAETPSKFTHRFKELRETDKSLRSLLFRMTLI